jgi:DNA helicase HerA-like ATPase
MKEIEQLRKYGQQLVSTLTDPEGGSPIERRALFTKLLEQHIAILGKTGSGKSYAAKGLAELLLARGQRVCVIDPTGVWWGLRADKTGRKTGFPIYIFGGEHGPGPAYRPVDDLLLQPHYGTTLGEIIGTTDTSAVLDTRIMTIKQRTTFFADFAETLLRTNRGPLTLMIDEAHLFMPQSRPSDIAGVRMLDAANNLVSLGRGIGLRIVLISQRPAKVHKDSITQSETLMVLRLIAPQDRRAIEDWIGEWAQPHEGREMLRSLASLRTGEGWVWAPELGVLESLTFPRITTYDSSKAPDGVTRQITKLPPMGASAMLDLAVIKKRLEEGAPPGRADKPRREKLDSTEAKENAQ